MRSNRALPSLAVTVATGALLAGCVVSEEARLAEPELDFPYTSTTATPTPSTSATATTTASSSSSSSSSNSSSSSSAKKSTSTKTTTSKRSSGGNSGGSQNDADEPAPRAEAPQAAAPEADEPGAACAWPAQGETGDAEFSTFCDREWARTVVPETGQQYFWQAQGKGWVSVDPAGTLDDGVCWDPAEFDGAPEAIRNAAVFCAPEGQ